MEELSHWLAATPLSRSLAALEWLVPMVQTVHLLAIALLLSLMLMVDVRVLGWTSRGPDAAQFSARTLPTAWRALAVLVASGAVLTVIEPQRELLSNLFRLKMLLVLLLVANGWFIGRQLSRQPDVLPRRAALGNLLLLLAIIAAGRFIAYA